MRKINIIKTIEIFNKRYIKKESGCWEWIGKQGANGYGQIRVGDRMETVSRFSYKIHNGEILDGLCVCHRCDNRMCVNPEHLFLGTKKDNTEDAIKKGRFRLPPREYGEDHPMAKLKNKDVIIIRELYKTNNYSHRNLAKMFGVSHALIGDIINFKLWK